ncbi:glycine cleavage system protein GcvH [Methylocystis echinoides]|jgi:glycine cleavage system H protein|uniref:glycine cleavage system protein GcvH n=1 Tax=Methylocystis echinoides TaxID=29468 RepID=UPI00342A40F0
MTGLRFTKDHEYLRLDGDAAVVGITDYAQEQLGDIVFVDLPKVGKKVTKGSELAVIESVKAASEVYAPISGEVVEVNAALGEKPALVNEDPMQGGWLVKLKVDAPGEVEGLMDADAYASFVKTL